MDLHLRLIYAGFTLYMMVILLRWFAPYLCIEVDEGRLRWISRLADPLINRMRRVLPPMGPVDFGPLAAWALVWLAREISLTVFQAG